MSLKKIFELLLFSFDTTHSSALMFSTAGTAGPDDVRVLVHRLAASRARTRTRADPGSTHARTHATRTSRVVAAARSPRALALAREGTEPRGRDSAETRASSFPPFIHSFVRVG